MKEDCSKVKNIDDIFFNFLLLGILDRIGLVDKKKTPSNRSIKKIKKIHLTCDI